jgi:SPX domain protein involved in polyphosphate accumulation
MRYERKYRIEGVNKALILQSIKMHPASLSPIHQPRQINNIYFDTPGFITYKDNVVGQAQRRKFRVRWYGEHIRYVDHPKLEIKIRNNELGDKKIFDISNFHLSNLKTLTQKVNQLCPEAGGMLRPVLLNSYQRQYFATKDQKFRLTLDDQLKYSPLLYSSFFLKHLFQEEQVRVLELKYEAELEAQADRLSQYIPFRRTKNSKYVTGVELCYY